jgi:hypothetical protein
MTIVVRTAVDPSSLSHAVIGSIQSLDKDLPVSHVVPMTEDIAAAVESQKFIASLLGLFGALALLLAVVGIVIGLGGALALTRFLRSMLFEIKPTDPATLIGVALLLLLVALVACYVPARRAMRVDPMVALRYE